MNDPDLRLLIIIVALIVIGAGVWYFQDDIWPEQSSPLVAEPSVPVAEPEERPGPIHPIEPPTPAGPGERELVPLPPLDDSDSYFLLEMINLFGQDAGNLLVKEALIDKFVATIDNLPRSAVSEKTRPAGRLATTFIVEETDDGGHVISEANFARYDNLVSLIATADVDAVVEVYRRFYPLIQESYVRLGYPNGYFNDRVVEVIDHLLAAPEPVGPIHLVRPNVLYEFADPDLQSLSSGQKIMIRIGSDNATRLKRVLRDIRRRIVS